ncbi:MAG: hypothetical protein V3V63_01380 [Candidatus Hydrothermarchaeaceae archaeon]
MFLHRRPSLEARRAMSESALKLGEDTSCVACHSEVVECKGVIKEMVGQKFVNPVASGNCAILAAVSAIDGKIMIPDQGGWRGFKDYPDLMGKEVCILETDLGVVNTDALDSELRKHNPGGLFLTSFAGYIAEQDIKEIAKICRENSVCLIEDISGAIGDKILARGDADITICSTGAPKIVNVLSGGFVSTDHKEILDRSARVTSACRISPVICAGITEELKNAPDIVERLVKYSAILKEELEDVVHRDSRGVCAGFEIDNPKRFVKRARENGLVTDANQGFLTACPRYERFLKNGVVVELKKLDILNVIEEDIAKIAEILKT